MVFAIYYFTTASGRSPVKDFVFTQDRQTRDKILEVIEYLRTYGFHLPTQYLRRMSGSRHLWELRARYNATQYRLFLAKTGETDILLLHGLVKKTQKTPKVAIETAEERLKAFRKGAV